jgi:hypothetical protein
MARPSTILTLHYKGLGFHPKPALKQKSNNLPTSMTTNHFKTGTEPASEKLGTSNTPDNGQRKTKERLPYAKSDGGNL